MSVLQVALRQIQTDTIICGQICLAPSGIKYQGPILGMWVSLFKGATMGEPRWWRSRWAWNASSKDASAYASTDRTVVTEH